jgi:23S rRNA pseudouridine2604 synthase
MKIIYPIRINKYLAEKKYCTRNGADTLIKQKRVYINGRLAKLGELINEKDTVEVRGNIDDKKKLVYLAYHKPRGVVTHSALKDEKEIAHQVPIQGIFPVGRLDKDSSGLIILTNDGRITKRLLEPEYGHTKEYVVTVRNKLRGNFKDRMESGVTIGKEKTRPCRVEIIDDYSFKIFLTEGKNRQIRRMCAALFNEVKTLKRISIMNIKLGKLSENQFRYIEGKELQEFLNLLKLS